MKLLLLLLLLVGCGSETGFVVYPINGERGEQGERGDKGDTGLAGQDGKDGATGAQGEKGDKGDSGVAGQDGYSIVSDSAYDSTLCGSVGGNTVMFAQDTNRNGILDCEDSLQNQFVVCDGMKGDKGDNGLDGQNGANGIGCTVSKVGTVATVTCDGSSVVVNDGTNGTNGTNGTDGRDGAAGLPGLPGTIVEIVELCPDSNVAFKEIALKIAPNKLIAFFQQTSSITVNAPGGQTSVLNNLKGRLVVLTNGNYQTTDGSGCNFSVNNGNIIN